MQDPSSGAPAPGKIPHVPAVVAVDLQNALAVFADHVRIGTRCSFDVAALSTLTACHMGLSIWQADTEAAGTQTEVSPPWKWET